MSDSVDNDTDEGKKLDFLSFRCTPEMRREVCEIAYLEDRTIGFVLRRFVRRALLDVDRSDRDEAWISKSALWMADLDGVPGPVDDA